MRAGMKGTISRIWSQRGSRPIALQQQEFEWVYTFGAVCPARGEAAAVVMPYANTDAMNVHLKEISQGSQDDGSCCSGIG